MSTKESLAALAASVNKTAASLSGKVSIPKVDGTVTTNWAKDPRASGDNGFWVQSSTTRSYESSSTLQWGHDTKTNVAFTFSAAGNGGGYYRFKPSDGLAATKVTGNLVRMGLEFIVAGATEGTTTVTVTGAWQFATGQVTATLLASTNVVNGRLYKVAGDYTWPSAGAITAGGTNDFYITVTLTNAPINCVLRMTNAHVDTPDFFAGDTPSTDNFKYSFAVANTVTSASLRTARVAGDGTKFYADDNTFKTVSSSGVPNDGSVTDAKVATGAAISADKLADGTNNKVMTSSERTKLSGVATGATANSTDAQLRDRSTHTGTQATSTITNFDAAAKAAAKAQRIIFYTGSAWPSVPTVVEEPNPIVWNSTKYAAAPPPNPGVDRIGDIWDQSPDAS